MRIASLICLTLPCLVMAQDTGTRIKAIADQFMSRQKDYYAAMAPKAGEKAAPKDPMTFFAQDIQSAEDRLRLEKDPEVQAALKITLVAFRAGTGLSTHTRGLDELARVSPVSPAWAVAPSLFLLAASTIKDNAARLAYCERAETGSPILALQEQLTLWMFVKKHDEKDEVAWKARLKRLEDVFPASESTKAARKIVKAATAVQLHKAAPAFEVDSLDAPGTHLTLDTYNGRYLLIDFWATWCAPCVAMLPTMEKLYARYHPLGLSILSIAEDKNSAIVQAFRKTSGHPMPWDLSVNPYDAKLRTHLNPIGDDYGLRALPTLVLIGPDGKVLAIGEDLHKDLGAALAKFILAPK